MSLLEQIKGDQIAARKAVDKNPVTINLLTTLFSEAGIVGKNANRESTDLEVIAIIKKFVNNSNTTLVEAQKRVAQIQEELKILEGYLPKQYSVEELTKIISDYITEHGKDMGKIMGFLKTFHAGLYDGKVASDIIKSL